MRHITLDSEKYLIQKQKMESEAQKSHHSKDSVTAFFQFLMASCIIFLIVNYSQYFEFIISMAQSWIFHMTN